MNALEGFERLAVAVRWIGRGLGAVFLALFLIVGFTSGDSRTMLAVSFICLGLAVVTVGNTAALAWVIEGFAKPGE